MAKAKKKLPKNPEGAAKYIAEVIDQSPGVYRSTPRYVGTLRDAKEVSSPSATRIRIFKVTYELISDKKI